MSEVIKFRFDFADLLAQAVDHRVIEGGMAVPEQARAVTAHARPGWLRQLLPIFAEGRGLRVEVARPAAPSFARVLQEGLAGLFAAAAAGSGVSVVGWEHGFLVGSHGLLRAPVLDQARGGELLLAADAARAAAFAAADPAPLRPLFSDAALAPLLPELTDLHRHRVRIEERDSSRRLVHWAAVEGGGDGVL